MCGKYRRIAPLAIGVLLLAGSAAYAQDSVAKTACLPADAVSPWDTGEQINNYVVDMTPFNTSWGTRFAVAPLVKSSKTSPTFIGSLTTAQALSRTQLVDIPLTGVYGLWDTAGFGVNPDPAINDAPASSVDLTGLQGNQFAAAVAEFSTTATMAEYNGILGALVRYIPDEPTRLYVSRIMGAVNSCDSNSNLAQFGLGAVDAYGNIHFRADDFNLTGGACGLSNLVGNNIFRAELANRTATLNTVSNSFPAGADAGAADWLVQNSGTTHNTPNIVPGPTDPLLIGSSFGAAFVRGTSSGTIVADSSHLAAGMIDHRGSVGYTTHDCAILNSTNGVAGILGRNGSNLMQTLNVWGLDASGNVTGTLALNLPATVTDPRNGRTTVAGINQFDHYHSQVATRGGNSQVALGRDAAGNLMVAAVCDQPEDFGPDWNVHYIPVARVNCDTGNVEWTLAAYNDSDPSFERKEILDGPGGTAIGELAFLNEITGAPNGPSFSAPMFDSAGNLWFLSAIEAYNDPNPSIFKGGLIRAVYDPVDFAYDLELVLSQGSTFRGQNSDRDYVVTFLAIADSNSVSSGTAWSGNISEQAFGGTTSVGLDPVDPDTLGGLVIAAEIVYDYNEDGNFNGCTDTGATEFIDPDYNVLLYIGSAGPNPAPAAPLPATGIHAPAKQRYISWTPDPAETSMYGFQVEHPLSGRSYYTSAPQTAPPTAVGRGITVLVSDASPVLYNWSVESVVHATGCMIAPGDQVNTAGQPHEYLVRSTADGVNFSNPLSVVTAGRPTDTRWWGDAVGAFSGGTWTAPNGLMNGFDVTAILRTFQNNPANPGTSLERADLNPETADRVVNGQDVLQAVNAFSIQNYPFRVPLGPGDNGQASCPVPPLSTP